MIVKAAETKPLTKTALAKQQGVSVSSLYYRPRQPAKDWHLKNQIEAVLKDNPSYGHRRLAAELHANKKRVLRVMKLFGLKPYRRRGRKWRKSKDNGCVYPNLLRLMNFPERSRTAWVSDFTYIPFHGRFVYLATIMDIYDRQIVGWSILTGHTAHLTIAALIDALEKHGRPMVLHSDQGSEYKSRTYATFADSLWIHFSEVAKSSRWANGYQGCFYSQLEYKLGEPK